MASAALVVALGATVNGCGGGDDGGDSASDGGAKNARPPSSAPPVPRDATLPEALTGQQVSWKSCPAPTALQGGGEAPGKAWECGTLKAPLNYEKPTGDTIDLAVIRKQATDGDQRIGSLIFNFGGPGGSGVGTLPSFADDYKKLGKRYDLVSFDPRGVGASEGVTCLSDAEQDAAAAVDNTPDDETELTAALAQSRKYAVACQHNSSKMLPRVDTVSAARDLDLMRQVLRDRKLHYFGISYGTELGGVYAHLFPKNVGRSVLDAVVDPTHGPAEHALAQAKGFQLALGNYLKDCARKGSRCPVGDDPASGSQQIAALVKKLDQQPLPVEDSSRKLTADQAVYGIAAALYDKEAWKYLSLGLQEATQRGQGSVLLALADSMAGRDEQGHYSNIQPANTAISCADSRQRYTPDQVKAKLPQFRAASPIFGDFVAWGLLSCDSWPVAGQQDHPEVSAAGAPPIVVIGNTGDPATPYEGARKMARQLGQGVGVELTYKGEGHGAYNSGSACMTEVVDGYLLDGKVPANGTTCS